MKRFVSVFLMVICMLSVLVLPVAATESVTSQAFDTSASNSTDSITTSNQASLSPSFSQTSDLSTKVTDTNKTQFTKPEQQKHSAVSIVLDGVTESNTITIIIQNQTSNDEYTLNFSKDQKYTTTVELTPGEYECIDVKADTKKFTVSCNEMLTVDETAPAQIVLKVNESPKANQAKELLSNNIIFITLLLGLCAALVISKKKNES